MTNMRSFWAEFAIVALRQLFYITVTVCVMLSITWVVLSIRLGG